MSTAAEFNALTHHQVVLVRYANRGDQSNTRHGDITAPAVAYRVHKTPDHKEKLFNCTEREKMRFVTAAFMARTFTIVEILG